jgi:hypothetical protein
MWDEIEPVETGVLHETPTEDVSMFLFRPEVNLTDSCPCEINRVLGSLLVGKVYYAGIDSCVLTHDVGVCRHSLRREL